MTTNTNISDEIVEYGFTLRDDATRLTLNVAEQYLCIELQQIITRATRLLEGLTTPGHAIGTIKELAHGVTSSGTIGTTWTGIVARATFVDSVLQYGTERTDGTVKA